MSTDTLGTASYSDGQYLQQHQEWHSERSIWKGDQVLRGLKMADITPTTLCDIGCGAGLVLAHVSRHLPSVVHATGFEPSPDAPQHESSVGKIDYRREDATAFDGHFDLALMLDVFEHVNDPYGFLEKCSHLADIFVFHVPLDANCLTILRGGFERPRRVSGHLHYYTDVSARALLTDVGFEILYSDFTKSGWEGANRNPWSPLNMMRRALFSASEQTTSRLFGGVSYLIVCRSPAARL
ncbi:MAG: class I SAM-dependent methyltransferase [Pseudomonadota bacterium]